MVSGISKVDMDCCVSDWNSMVLIVCGALSQLEFPVPIAVHSFCTHESALVNTKQ